MKKRLTEEQIIGFLREVGAGLPIKELCRPHGFTKASYCLWRSKFGTAPVPDNRFPVVLISHGRGGSPFSHRELASALARS